MNLFNYLGYKNNVSTNTKPKSDDDLYKEFSEIMTNMEYNKRMSRVKLIAGRSNTELANLISTHLNIPLTPVKFSDFCNTEINVEIRDNIRGYDVFIIQTGGAYKNKSINDYLQELYALIHACKLSSSKTITLVMPCYAYARSDKKDAPRVPIMGSCQALIYSSLGVDRIVTMDLHSGQIQGFFQCNPMDNLYGINLHIKNFEDTIFNGLSHDEINERYVLAAPDVGAAKRLEAYAKRLKMGHVLMHKHRSYEIENTVLNTILIGENNAVKDKTVIIVDDMMDTLGTMVSAAEELKKHGAEDVILVATHGIFSGPAMERLNSCEMISKVIVMNTLPQEENLRKTTKLQIVDISKLFATVIKRLQTNEAGISELFQ